MDVGLSVFADPINFDSSILERKLWVFLKSFIFSIPVPNNFFCNDLTLIVSFSVANSNALKYSISIADCFTCWSTWLDKFNKTSLPSSILYFCSNSSTLLGILVSGGKIIVSNGSASVGSALPFTSIWTSPSLLSSADTFTCGKSFLIFWFCFSWDIKSTNSDLCKLFKSSNFLFSTPVILLINDLNLLLDIFNSFFRLFNCLSRSL